MLSKSVEGVRKQKNIKNLCCYAWADEKNILRNKRKSVGSEMEKKISGGRNFDTHVRLFCEILKSFCFKIDEISGKFHQN